MKQITYQTHCQALVICFNFFDFWVDSLAVWTIPFISSDSLPGLRFTVQPICASTTWSFTCSVLSVTSAAWKESGINTSGPDASSSMLQLLWCYSGWRRSWTAGCSRPSHGRSNRDRLFVCPRRMTRKLSDVCFISLVVTQRAAAPRHRWLAYLSLMTGGKTKQPASRFYCIN